MDESRYSITSDALDPEDARKCVLEHHGFLERLAKRRFHDANVADEALDFVLVSLKANDWQKVRAFKGESLFSTYISHVAVRLLEDYARMKYGRKRAPHWIKCHGNLWEEVYRLLCLERMGRVDVVETLTVSRREARVRQMVEEAVEVILSRISDCGDRRGEMVSMDFQDGAKQIPESSIRESLSPEDIHIAYQRLSIIQALGRCLTSEDGTETVHFPRAERIHLMVLAMSAHLNLTSEDRLLLRMVYRDGLSTSAAGRRLGLETNQVHGRLRRTLDRIRKAFEKTGLLEELKLLLEETT
jgi:RNA polymerase sigma factor (sigma-70 family)